MDKLASAQAENIGNLQLIGNLQESLTSKDEVMESLNLAYTVRIDELKAREQKLLAALDLALYYVEGDATYEGLCQQIKDRFGIDCLTLKDPSGSIEKTAGSIS